ncbi:MAG: DUF4261 domain-containing protein [Oscillospiraceae bacterium]|nr:DUF4261 domain-containing protein [Oscillospiraceae bacterium]
MGIFDKSKKEDKREGAVMPSFVLLSDIAFDPDLFAKTLKEDWGIELPAGDAQNKDDDAQPMIVTELDGMTVAISLMPGPVPNGEAVEVAKNNFRWPDAIKVAESHKAHVLIIVMPLKNQPLAEVAALHTKLCATCLKQPGAIAINAAGTVFDPAFYIGSAKFAIENNVFPIMNHIFFGIYSNDDGKTISGYTYGLETLGKQDLEILDSPRTADEVLGFLIDISAYIMGSDVTLKHGETLGATEAQKLAITESDGVALASKTLKIDF